MAMIDRGPVYNQQRYLLYLEHKQHMFNMNCPSWDYATYCARYEGDHDTEGVWIKPEGGYHVF